MPHSSTRWLVGKNTAAQLLGKAISSGIALILTILIARRFGAAGYGDFTKITTYVAFFYLIADFGLNAVYLQQLQSVSQEKKYRLWHALLVLRLFLATGLVLISLLMLPFLPGTGSQGYTNLVKLGILLFSPTIILQAMLVTANAVFQQRLRYDLSAVATSIGSLISLILVFVAPQYSIIPTVGALLLGMMATAGIAIFFSLRLHKSWTLSTDIPMMKQLFVSGLPLAATLLFNLVYFRADSIILTLTRSTAEVGIYGFAYKIFEFPLVIPTFFMNSLYPLLLGANQQPHRFSHLLKKSGIILLLSSIFFVAIFWFTAPLATFIKPEFSQSILPLRILVMGLPFFFLSSLTMWSLIARKKQVTLAAIYAVAMAGNILFNLWLIPSYGYVAAAWVTVASEAFVLALSGLILLKSSV